MKPQRIQLSRKAGFNLQEASRKLNGLPAVNCARPSPWGNLFKVGDRPAGNYTLEQALNLFRCYSSNKSKRNPEWIMPLRGKNLACFCALDKPCHCDVLLEIANA